MDRKLVHWNNRWGKERRRSGANDLDAIPTRVRVAPVECGVHQEYTIARLHKSIWIGGTRPRSICCHYFAIPAKRTRWTVDQGREEARSVRYATRNRCEIYRFIRVSRWQIEREIAIVIIYTLHRYDLAVRIDDNKWDDNGISTELSIQRGNKSNFSSRSKINIVRSICDERS